MEGQKEYLNEERYQKTKKTIAFTALIVLLVGIIIGGGLIGLGFSNRNSIDVTSIRTQQTAEFRKNGFSAKYYELDAQLDKAESATPLFMIGGFIIIASCMISGSIFISTKRREILAYHAQQIRPVAQEGIEKMAPSAAVAAKEIAKGIKEGLKDDENN